MIENEFEQMQKFYSEKALADMLGVSRNTVREAIRQLEQEGILYSKQGVGTFVISSNNSVKTNINNLESSTVIIRDNGYEPGTINLRSKQINASKKIVKKLGLNEDNPKEIFYVERVRTANKKPVVFVEDYLPVRKKIVENFETEFNESLLEFLEQLGYSTEFSLTTIKSVISNKKIMNKMNLDNQKALLHLEQLHFTNKGQPIFYSDSYFISEKFEFSVVRK